VVFKGKDWQTPQKQGLEDNFRNNGRKHESNRGGN